MTNTGADLKWTCTWPDILVYLNLRNMCYDLLRKNWFSFDWLYWSVYRQGRAIHLMFSEQAIIYSNRLTSWAYHCFKYDSELYAIVLIPYIPNMSSSPYSNKHCILTLCQNHRYTSYVLLSFKIGFLMSYTLHMASLIAQKHGAIQSSIYRLLSTSYIPKTREWHGHMDKSMSVVGKFSFCLFKVPKVCDVAPYTTTHWR